MNITLRQLDYFLALAETRHFGQAAIRVNVSQPALSVQIRELEDRLGAALVMRDTKPLSLTREGQEVLAAAGRIRAELERMELALRWRDGLAGHLNLGVIPTIAPYLLPAALPQLRARDLRIELRVREAQTTELLADLADGRLDAAVMALPSGVPGLIEQPLFTDPFRLAGSSDQINRLRNRSEALRPANLDPDRLLLLDEGHCLADQALEVCELDRSATRVDLGASSLSTLCGLVAEGFGLTFLPRLACASECAATPALTTLDFAAPEPARIVGLVRQARVSGGHWFDDLAQVLSQAGGDVIARTAR